VNYRDYLNARKTNSSKLSSSRSKNVSRRSFRFMSLGGDHSLRNRCRINSSSSILIPSLIFHLRENGIAVDLRSSIRFDMIYLSLGSHLSCTYISNSLVEPQNALFDLDRY
jgi:hypothetical protein